MDFNTEMGKYEVISVYVQLFVMEQLATTPPQQIGTHTLKCPFIKV